MSFQPSTASGRVWKVHAEGCPDCKSRAALSDARCDVGVALRDAYTESLAEPQGDQVSVQDVLLRKRGW